MTQELKTEYDEAMTTPSDYTLHMYIEPSITEYFNEKEFNAGDTQRSRG